MSRQSASIQSLVQPPPEYRAYPMNIPGCIFVPIWWRRLFLSFLEIELKEFDATMVYLDNPMNFFKKKRFSRAEVEKFGTRPAVVKKKVSSASTWATTLCSGKRKRKKDKGWQREEKRTKADSGSNMGARQRWTRHVRQGWQGQLVRPHWFLVSKPKHAEAAVEQRWHKPSRDADMASFGGKTERTRFGVSRCQPVGQVTYWVHDCIPWSVLPPCKAQRNRQISTHSVGAKIANLHPTCYSRRASWWTTWLSFIAVTACGAPLIWTSKASTSSGNVCGSAQFGLEWSGAWRRHGRQPPWPPSLNDDSAHPLRHSNPAPSQWSAVWLRRIQLVTRSCQWGRAEAGLLVA